MYIKKTFCAFLFCLSSLFNFSQTETFDKTALDSIYNHLKSNLGKQKIDLGIFDTLNDALEHVGTDTTAALFYHKFANLRLDMGHWDSIAEQMHQKGYDRIKTSGYDCKLAVSQFNLTRFALFQDDPNLTLKRASHALEIANRCGETEKIAHAQSYIGAAYINLSDYKNALKSLIDSEKNYTSINDSSGIAMVNLDLAMVYSEMQEEEKSIEATKKAALIYKNKGEELRYAIALIDMCSSYLDIKQTDSVQKYLPIAHKIVINKHQLANAYVYQHYGNLNIQLGDYNKAIDNLKNALKVNKNIDDSSLNINLYNFLVVAYKKKNAPRLAYEYALKSDSVSKISNDKYSRLKSLLTLADASYEVNNNTLSHASFKEYIKLKDSILGADKIKEIAALEKFYEAEKRENQIKIHQQENDILSAKNKASNNRNISLFIALLLLAAIAYAFINKFRLKALKQEAIAKVKELENDNLNQKVDYQKRELASKALHIAQKNELLTELKADLSELKKQNGNNVQVNHLFNKLHIEKQIDDNWEQFTNQFIEMNPDFYGNITNSYSNLTKNDIRLIALLKMKFDSNTIASLLNISLEGVKKARYRLRKKLSLSSEDNLENHIMSL
ncbi:hypothetical protein [uncultured Psychroserpens sp.]|uniref:hypothetical protein n=1 Tax=uncultured Psychroserpens sp. TaxID=255436 RepID=UPI0026165752|nr:hypothetical protein [uncultured Psychroserpens sp.]